MYSGERTSKGIGNLFKQTMHLQTHRISITFGMPQKLRSLVVISYSSLNVYTLASKKHHDMYSTGRLSKLAEQRVKGYL